MTNVFRAPIEWRHADGATLSAFDRPMAPYIAVQTLSADDRIIRILALVDTGAAIALLVPDLISDLGLVAEGESNMIGHTGIVRRTIYGVRMRVPGLPVTFSAVCAPTEDALGFPEARMVLGMDVLRLGRLILDVRGASYWEIPLVAMASGPISAPPPSGSR